MYALYCTARVRSVWMYLWTVYLAFDQLNIINQVKYFTVDLRRIFFSPVLCRVRHAVMWRRRRRGFCCHQDGGTCPRFVPPLLLGSCATFSLFSRRNWQHGADYTAELAAGSARRPWKERLHLSPTAGSDGGEQLSGLEKPSDRSCC